MLSGEATNTNFKVFGFTRSGLVPTIYLTRVHCVIPKCCTDCTAYDDCIVYTDCIYNSLAFFLTMKAMPKTISLCKIARSSEMLLLPLFVQVYNNELEYNDDTIKINIIDQTESRYKSLRRYRLQCDLSRFCLSCLGPLVYCIQKFKLFCFPIFPYWGYLMKVFPETCRAQ